jgi:hypothetical protein
MAFAARARGGRSGKRYSPPPEILGYSIPDPAGWCPATCAWYQEITEEWAQGPSDIFIFQTGGHCRIVLQDAISVVGLTGALTIAPEEWITEGGYPDFSFSVARLPEVVRVLESAKYRVRILFRLEAQPLDTQGHRKPADTAGANKGRVVCINAARRKPRQ